jgi:transposase InsO family protein
MDAVTKIHLCWKLYNLGLSPEKIPDEIAVHRATVYRWIRQLRRKGVQQFIQDYRLAKKGRRHRKTNERLKQRIYEIREEYRLCCGEKIRYFLQQKYGESASVSTIYRILGEKYVLRGTWRKNQPRGFVIKGTKPREVIQVDTVDFGNVYAFTAIDTFTREAHVVLKTRLDAKAGEEAFVEQLRYFGRVDGVQRDGGPEFKAEWQTLAEKHVKRIRTAKPYRKNEQAFIERFNGILRKECLGHLKYTKKDLPRLHDELDEFLKYYHYERPHLSLGMLTPHQFAMSHLT